MSFSLFLCIGFDCACGVIHCHEKQLKALSRQTQESAGFENDLDDRRVSLDEEIYYDARETLEETVYLTEDEYNESMALEKIAELIREKQCSNYQQTVHMLAASVTEVENQAAISTVNAVENIAEMSQRSLAEARSKEKSQRKSKGVKKSHTKHHNRQIEKLNVCKLRVENSREKELRQEEKHEKPLRIEKKKEDQKSREDDYELKQAARQEARILEDEERRIRNQEDYELMLEEEQKIRENHEEAMRKYQEEEERRVQEDRQKEDERKEHERVEEEHGRVQNSEEDRLREVDLLREEDRRKNEWRLLELLPPIPTQGTIDLFLSLPDVPEENPGASSTRLREAERVNEK